MLKAYDKKKEQKGKMTDALRWEVFYNLSIQETHQEAPQQYIQILLGCISQYVLEFRKSLGQKLKYSDAF